MSEHSGRLLFNSVNTVEDSSLTESMRNDELSNISANSTIKSKFTRLSHSWARKGLVDTERVLNLVHLYYFYGKSCILFSPIFPNISELLYDFCGSAGTISSFYCLYKPGWHNAVTTISVFLTSGPASLFFLWPPSPSPHRPGLWLLEQWP